MTDHIKCDIHGYHMGRKNWADCELSRLRSELEQSTARLHEVFGERDCARHELEESRGREDAQKKRLAQIEAEASVALAFGKDYAESLRYIRKTAEAALSPAPTIKPEPKEK